MSPFQDDDPVAKSYDSRLLLRLLTYLRPYKAAVAAAFVLILAMSGARPGRSLPDQGRDRPLHHPRRRGGAC